MKKNVNISYPVEGNSEFSEIEDESFWFKHRNNIFFDKISKYSPKDPFYDIGGGNGFISSFLQMNGLDTILIEPGLQGIEKAKNRGLKNTFHGVLNDFDFSKSGLMRAAGCFDVIEHIENDIKFVSDIYNKMEVGAYFYVSVPAHNLLWSYEDIDAGHFRRYSLSQISDVLTVNRFRIIYKSYIFSFLPLPIFLTRTIKYKFKFLGRSKVNHKKDHVKNKGISKSILSKILGWEYNRISQNKSIPIGSSCFIIAIKD